jgi:hypothetical protein
MTDDHEAEHGDATLDVLALLEATIKDDGHGLHVLLDSVLDSGNLSHVLGTLVGNFADLLTMNFGHDGALELLNHQRGHALNPHPRGHALNPHECEPAGGSEHVHGEMGGLDDIAYELSDIGEGITRLTDAVLRVGDILDKRLA